jgi:hypothetical protein
MYPNLLTDQMSVVFSSVPVFRSVIGARPDERE